MSKLKKILLISIGVLLIAIATVVIILIIKDKKEALKTENSADYTIKYNYNYDNLSKDVVVEENESAEGLLVERPNYSFVGWYSDGVLFDFSKPIKSNVVLTAVWQEKQEGEYTVVFNSDGGTTVNNQVVKSGGTIEEPAAPIRSNYSFLGWYLNGTLYDFKTLLSSDLILVAKWQKVTTTNNNTNTKTDTNTNTETNNNTNTETNLDDTNDTEAVTLSKVNNVFVEYSSLGDVVISFGPSNEEISGYEVYRSLSTNDDYEKIATTKTNSTRNVYDSSKDYKYKVRSYKSISSGTVYGIYSDIVNVPKRPVNPTGVFFSASYSSNSYSVDLKFDKTGSDKYIIYSGTNGKDDYGVLQTINGSANQSFSYYFTNFNIYKATYFKIISVKEGTNYKISSYPATDYYIPYLNSSINLDVVTYRTTLDGGGYSEKSTYSWNAISDADYYMIQQYKYEKDSNNMMALVPGLGNYKITGSSQTSYTVNSSAFQYSSVIFHKVSSYYDISRSSTKKTATIVEQ